jgi:PncC family amidohydrolase
MTMAAEHSTTERSITDLAAHVIALATAQRISLITAESCTAGALATLLADTPGAGDVLQGGIVSYAKSCKTALLDIDRQFIERHSAVSAEVAHAMAEGALRSCEPADVAVAITCVGGPEPDDDGNPVGLTFIAMRDRSGRSIEEKRSIAGQSSGRVRGQVLEAALELAIRFLEQRSA